MCKVKFLDRFRVLVMFIHWMFFKLIVKRHQILKVQFFCQTETSAQLRNFETNTRTFFALKKLVLGRGSGWGRGQSQEGIEFCKKLFLMKINFTVFLRDFIIVFITIETIENSLKCLVMYLLKFRVLHFPVKHPDNYSSCLKIPCIEALPNRKFFITDTLSI